MKTYERVKIQFHVFSLTAPNKDERLASCPDVFTPEESVPYTHWINAGWAPESVWTL
jgi:hypothetical protein